jgi:2-C-methyl-D-erythritol 2,4-cyclodiphosphate synthase
MPGVSVGYDLHRLVPGRVLTIGGVTIDSPFGAEAHSDGDVLLHALIDALLSGAGLDDIGTLFPDSDPQYRDISSLELLHRAWAQVSGRITVYNFDSVVILDKPKIAGHIMKMKENISSIIELSPEKIGIKGKTTENTRLMTIEAHVVCLYESRNP